MAGHFKPIAHGTYKGFRQHDRRGDKPLHGTCGCREAQNRYVRERKDSRPKGTCPECGRKDQPLCGHGGRYLCRTCYSRWQMRGFTEPGPGPGFCPAIERAREHRETITTMTAQQAGWRIGVTARTVERWKKLLREEAP